MNIVGNKLFSMKVKQISCLIIISVYQTYLVSCFSWFPQKKAKNSIVLHSDTKQNTFQISEDDDTFFDQIIEARRNKYVELIEEQELDLELFVQLDPSIQISCLAKTLPPETLHQCIYDYNNVADSTKTRLATELAVCQLRANNIEIPLACIGLSQDGRLDKCLQKLYGTPQLWTTFDACYKSISFGCLQESFKYESSKVAELHLNLTQYQKNIYKVMMDNLKDYNAFKDNVLEKVLNQVENQLSKQFIQFMEHAKQVNDIHLLNIINRQETKLGELFENYESIVTFNIQQLERYFLSKKVEMYNTFEINKMFLNNSAIQLRNIVEESTEKLLNSTAIVAQKLNHSLSQATMLENKFNTTIDLFSFKLTVLASSLYTRFTWITDFLAYLVIASILVYATLYYIRTQVFEWLKAESTPTSNRVLVKLGKLCFFNIFAYFLGRSIVICYLNFIKQ